MLLKIPEVRLGIGARAATLAFDEQIRAVQLNESLIAGASRGVQPVDVLGDSQQQLSRLSQLYNGIVHRIGPRVTESLPAFQLIVPMLNPRGFRAHEIIVVHRLPALHTPCGPRKSGIPLPVEMPAPVKM